MRDRALSLGRGREPGAPRRVLFCRPYPQRRPFDLLLSFSSASSAAGQMCQSLGQRTVIIGNSGAGKSALAESLAALIHVPVIDLDLLNWEGDGYGRKRDEDAARRMILEVAAQPLWIIEGVYGW